MMLALATILTLAVTLAVAPALAQEAPWEEGDVTEVPKPLGFSAFGTTPSGILTARLTTGFLYYAGTQTAFLDFRVQDGDLSYGLNGGFPFGARTVQATRWNLYVATPQIQASFGSDGWTAAYTRHLTSDISVRIAAGPTWQSVSLHAASGGWSAVATYLMHGTPTALVAVQYSEVWTWAK